MKILIVKIGAIGDVAMALPMAEALLAQFPDSRITWICGSQAEPLVRAYGRAAEVMAVEEGALLRGTWAQRLRVLAPLWARLFGRPFDLVLTAHSDPRYALLGATVRAGERRSLRGRRGLVPGRYHGDEYVRLATGKDGPDAPRAVLPKLSAPSGGAWSAFVESHPKPWVALAPGGAQNLLRDDALRRWPLESYGRLADRLKAGGFQVVLTGAEGDGWVREVFRDRDCLDLIGKTSLTDLVALYARCRLVVTHDSGPVHLAALSGANVLALFGPTRPSEKVPPGGRVRALWGGEELPCRPCYDGKNYAACSRNLCLEELPVERVWKEAERILGVDR